MTTPRHPAAPSPRPPPAAAAACRACGVPRRALGRALRWVSALALSAAGAAQAQHPGPHDAHHHGHTGPAAADGDHATMRHRFTDVAWAVKRFEDPERAAWQKPEALVKALGIAPGATVADLGAGTGYFLPALVAAVGPAGTVVALDVEPELVAHLRARAEQMGWHGVVPVLSSFDRPRLPAASLDLAILVNVYHHIDDRKAWFAHARGALRPGGRLVVVDFKPGPMPVGPPDGHKIGAEQIRREVEAAGLTFVEALDLLPYQNTLVFKVAGATAPPAPPAP